MKRTYKIATYSLITLLALLLLIISCFIVTINTEMGTGCLLKVIPGLTVKESKGSLNGGWSAKQLIWQNDSIKITITNPSITWYASCLLKAHVCIDQLNANQLSIVQAEQPKQPHNTAESSEAISLPTIHLPITIAIQQVSLNTVTLNNQPIIEGIKLIHLTWQNSKINVAKLLATYQDKATAELTGNLSLSNNWSLQLHGQLNLNHLINQPWFIKIDTFGELQQQLTFTISSQGFLNANLKAQAAVLDKNIPAQLSLTAQDFYPTSLIDIPETLTIKQLKLNVAGDLQTGYKLQNEAILAGHTNPVRVTANGLLTAQNLQLTPLRLSTSDQHFVDIVGQIDWRSLLTAHADIKYQAFPWLELYPLDSSPPVNLDNLQANLSYQQNNYQAKLQAQLSGPAGPFNLTTELQGNLQTVILNKLLVNTPDKGIIKGQAKVTFDPSISWFTDISLQAINPNYWLPQLTGQLQGTIHSDGSLINNHINTQTKIDINGTLHKQKTLIKAQVIAKNEQWQLPELLIALGNNQIKGQAQLAKQLQAQLDFNLPTLQQILPDLAGSLKGQAKLAGTIEKPQGSINIMGQRLGYQGQHIKQLQLIATLNRLQQGQLTLQAKQIKTSDTLLGNLVVSGSGNLTKQQLNLQLTKGIVTLLTTMESKQDKQSNWDIAVNKLQINSQGQHWQLQQTALLHYTTTGVLTLNEHCLQNGKATLCSIGQQKLLPDTKINYQLANFPLDSLTPWLPENLKWQGILTATIDVKIPQQGPTGHINMNANNGAFKLRESTEDKWQTFAYKELYLTTQLTPNKMGSLFKFTGGTLGNIEANLDLNPLTRHKSLAGHFKITGFDLNILQPFIAQAEQLTGKISGLGSISGNLEKPYISGKITLNNGNLIGDFPISLEKLHMMAMIEGENIKLDGNWRSGSAGYGSLKGGISWSKALDINLSLQTKNLPVVVAPYAKLEAATDLKLMIYNNALYLTGNVQIPKGTITVRELPPSTVKLSPDATIVKDQTASNQQNPLQLNMDIDVLIGGERLKFSGFGLTSDVTGKLKVSNNLLTHGEVNLKEGQFRAYGQRLELRRARVIFAGSLTEPTLDIEAVRVVDDVTAGLKVTGLTSQPKVTIFSTPSMSQDQALSYIILGRPMGSGDSNMLARAALVLGVAGGSPIIGEFASKVGIEDFQLDTAGSGDKTSVVASGNITDKLSVHYGFNIFQAVNNLMVRYKLTKTLYLEAASGVDSSLDLFYKKSF